MERTSNAIPSGQPNWKHKIIRATALTTAIAIGTSMAFMAVASTARGPGAHPGGHDAFMVGMHGGHSAGEMHAHFEKVLADAGASDAQKQQIRTIMKAAMGAEHADMGRFHESLRQLKALLTADTIDDGAIARVRDEQDRLLLATSHRLSDALVAAAKTLNPAQRAKLGAEIDRMMADHEGHHHGG